MLSVRNVTFKYGKALALSDVSFDAAAGQVVLVVGGSCSGKSALLDCIAGVSAFDGSIAVGGTSCRSFRARRLVGYLRDPLDPRSGSLVYDKLSCDEHIAFLRRAFSLDAEGVKYACSLLASFGLDQYRYCPAGELSASARRRLEIVMALAPRPGLLLLDRPALGLDKVYAEELYASLLALKLRGTAVVIAVSDVDEIGAVWDVGYELRGGRIIGSFAPAVADVPGQTDVPVAADIPQQTDAPPVADIPQQTDAPVVVDIPQQTDVPVVADIPRQTDATAVADIPQQTDVQAVADIPQQADAQAVADIPQQADVPPVVADIPQQTDAQAVNNAPDQADVLGSDIPQAVDSSADDAVTSQVSENTEVVL